MEEAEARLKQAVKQDPDIAKVNQKRFWNQCPHFPELNLASANFLIWHRAYVYYFERILRDAADNRLRARRAHRRASLSKRADDAAS